MSERPNLNIVFATAESLVIVCCDEICVPAVSPKLAFSFPRLYGAVDDRN
jgi:hypothetical protein